MLRQPQTEEGLWISQYQL
ncbi:unnamed protein product [Staurois parvus]|uniref:Uncharacterized protein n=1 Tax=Staurois parvus TaxID=386267 RepID=A0ABN9AQ47_9NEOB|nr:unnamed protein product [Staurois parvus]